MDVNSATKPEVQPVPAPKRPTETRPAAAQANNKPQENETQKAAQAQQNKPVLNTQGQITGRNLNVTA